MKAESFSCQVFPLANEFLQLTVYSKLLAEQAKSGHFLLLEDQFPCYIMGKQDNAIDLILSPAFSFLKNNTNIQASLHGQPLEEPLEGPFTVLLIENEALAAGIFYLKQYRHQFKGLVLIGTTDHFPFKPCPSRQLITGMPADVIASIPLLEDWHIPHRLASLVEKPGCFYGNVDQLLNEWLKTKHYKIIEKRIPLLYSI